MAFPLSREATWHYRGLPAALDVGSVMYHLRARFDDADFLLRQRDERTLEVHGVGRYAARGVISFEVLPDDEQHPGRSRMPSGRASTVVTRFRFRNPREFLELPLFTLAGCSVLSLSQDWKQHASSSREFLLAAAVYLAIVLVVALVAGSISALVAKSRVRQLIAHAVRDAGAELSATEQQRHASEALGRSR